MCIPGVFSLGGDVYVQLNPHMQQELNRTSLTNKLMDMSIALRIAGIALGAIAFASVVYTAGMQTIGTITLIAGTVAGIIAHDLISLGEATTIGAELPFMFSESLGLPDSFVNEVIKTILAFIHHVRN